MTAAATEPKAAKGFRPLDLPSAWEGKYTDESKDQVARIVAWMNAHEKTIAWLSAASGVNRTTLYMLVEGHYKGRVDAFLKQVLDTIRHIDERRSVKETPFIASSVTRLVFAACTRARQYKSFAVVAAEVGTGKTRALMEYQKENANTVMIQADPRMSSRALMDELMAALQLSAARKYAAVEMKFRIVVDALKGTETLLILDEAETVNENTLHYIRRIRDKAEVGVVLAGTPRLHTLISPRGGQFDQIRSRVSYWPKTVRGITREDMDAVATAAFEDQGEIDAATLQALWHHTKGSMRMLVEDLIPAIRDYGLRLHPLSAELVHAVASDVLSLDR